MREAEKIACINRPGFDLSFSIQWQTADGTWHTGKWDSGTYPTLQTRISPSPFSTSVGVPRGAVAVRPYVHAVLGKHQEGSAVVRAADNDQTAAYEVHGTTLNFSVVPSSEPTWQNWSQNIVHVPPADGENYNF
jgi:hypothetical protein